jgi:hypothetical protein
MKKWVIGCGLALLIVLVVGVGAGYWFVYRPAQAYLASFRQLGEIAELDKRVANKSTFTPPDNGELTKATVTRFVKVQEEIQSRLGGRAAELKAKYDQIEAAQKGDKRSASFGEVLGAMKDLAGIIVEGKRAQVEALNQSQFSLEEYQWVRQAVYAAAGVTLSEIDLRNIATRNSSNRTPRSSRSGWGWPSSVSRSGATLEGDSIGGALDRDERFVGAAILSTF